MAITNFIWDNLSDNVLMETDENGAVIANYTNEPSQFGEVLSQHRHGQDQYFHFDGLGSTRNLTGQNEAVTDSYSYTAFGETVASSGSTPNPFRYNGAVGYYTNSETNDFYVRRRTYDPIVNRWLSLDPLGYIDGPNRYSYVQNFAPNNMDPSGEIKVKRDHPPPRVEPTCDFIYGQQNFRMDLTADKWPCRSNKAFFIQQVTVHCHLTKCPADSPFIQEHYTYFESFLRTRRGSGTPHFIDTVNYGTNYPRSSFRQNGVIKFFCVTPSKSLPIGGEITEDELEEWKSGDVIGATNPCNVSSIFAPHTLDAPTWWNREHADPPNGFRTFQMFWNCCCNPVVQYARLETQP